MKLKYMMLVVLFKKTDYNTRCAEIDNKVSSLDGKSAENKTKNVSIENALKGLIKDLYFFIATNIFFGGSDDYQVYLIFQS